MAKAPTKGVVAYVDGANLYKGVEKLGWKLDYKRFRVWLTENYGVETAYLFIGMVPANKDLYRRLEASGYSLVYKEIVYDADGKVKGNCDADLVVKAMSDLMDGVLTKAVLVSSDGDYASLVTFFMKRNAFGGVVSPSNKCSYLLRKLNIKITYLDGLQSRIGQRPK